MLISRRVQPKKYGTYLNSAGLDGYLNDFIFAYGRITEISNFASGIFGQVLGNFAQ